MVLFLLYGQKKSSFFYFSGLLGLGSCKDLLSPWDLSSSLPSTELVSREDRAEVFSVMLHDDLPLRLLLQRWRRLAAWLELEGQILLRWGPGWERSPRGFTAGERELGGEYLRLAVNERGMGDPLGCTDVLGDR